MPDIIEYYNQMKSGVDTVGEMIHVMWPGTPEDGLWLYSTQF